MHKEIETRFLDINKEGLIKKLISLSAVDNGENKLEEIIFYDKDLNWLNENKLVKLRKSKDVVKLIYKNNKEQTTDSAKEIEFEISNMEAGRDFLEAVGLKQYRIIEKYRHTFILDNVTIDIDTWPKIPVYVELEGDSIDSLKGIAERLGLNWENRFDMDPRFVFKKYGFDFDKIKVVTFNKFE